MTRLAASLLAALLALPALANGPVPKQPARATRASPGKARAPATVSTRLGDGVATVTVRFDAAATDVTIGVGGVDGLAVTSDPTPLTGGRFARGQSVSFDVAFTPGPGRSHLAVTVGGTFGGQQRHVAQSFAVGSPTAEQLKPAVPATTDSTGERIKVMPAGGN